MCIMMFACMVVLFLLIERDIFDNVGWCLLFYFDVLCIVNGNLVIVQVSILQ
jgi:hypothetical protein